MSIENVEKINKQVLTKLKKRHTIVVQQHIRERGENMSEKEQKIIESISDALPKMSDFDKGYFLGAAEQMVSEKEKKMPEKVIRGNLEEEVV